MENKTKNKQKVWLTIIGIFLILISIVSIICFLLSGQTTTTGQTGSIVSSNSLTCEGNNIPYQFLSYDNAKSKNAKITASFNDDKLNAISFSYTLYYGSPEQAEESKTINSAELNVFYGKDGLPANSFSKSLYADNEKTVISLYANTDDFNDRTSKYFIADGLGKNSSFDSFVKKYEEQGFICKQNNQGKETDEK